MHLLGIFVVSSTHEDKDVENLTDTYVKMFDQVIKLPGLFTEGFMDTNLLRYHVLLHDNHDDIKRYVKRNKICLFNLIN